jgi:hypothetical protein
LSNRETHPKTTRRSDTRTRYLAPKKSHRDNLPRWTYKEVRAPETDTHPRQAKTVKNTPRHAETKKDEKKQKKTKKDKKCAMFYLWQTARKKGTNEQARTNNRPTNGNY